MERPCSRETIGSKTQGEIEAAVCDGIRRFETEYMGRGPRDIRAHLVGDLVIVRLTEVLTAAEQHLAASASPERGRDLLKQVRTHLIETGRSAIDAMLRISTGVQPISLHHDISTVAGASAGALWGLGILAGVLPAIGPAIAGGTLAVLLSSAAAGAAAAGLAGALIGMGLSPDEAEYYETEMKSGRTIVTVQAGARRQEALNLIQEFGGYDISSRESATRQTTPGSQFAAPESSSRMKDQSKKGNMGQQSTSQALSGTHDQTIQAREERLNIQKRPVDEGEVTVRKEVRTEHKTVDVPVTREEVVIERHPGHGQRASSETLGEGKEIRVPVRSEEVDIQKETVVAEEVTVGKRRVQETERVDENLRKEEIRVEKRGDVDVKDTKR